MLVLQKAIRMVWELPDVMRVAYAFVLVMFFWMALWSFGVSGIVAMPIPNRGQWWLVLVRASWSKFDFNVFFAFIYLSNDYPAICRLYQSVYFGLELSLVIRSMS